MTGASDSAKAFRGAMEGLVAEHASSVRAVRQRWDDTAAAADKNASEQVDKARKLVARVRQRAEDLRKQEERDDRGEIEYVEEQEPDEVDPEVERLSQQVDETRRVRERAESASGPAGQQPGPSPTTPSAVPDPSAWSRPGRSGRSDVGQDDVAGDVSAPGNAEPAAGQGWAAKAGRFGRGEQRRSGRSDRPDARESDVDEPAEEAAGSPDRRWQVRAGRFGRGDQPSSSEQRARPARPAANRRPVDDADDEDFSGGSWLR